jgi:hypothetical protein
MVGVTVGIVAVTAKFANRFEARVIQKSTKICRLWHIGQSPLAYSAVMAAIDQWSPQPLWEWPQLAN